ncbi:nucleotidyltransferase substrate binding protein [Spirosoma montaniterrae]|uniref:Nucleotidyltransferase n=1 Tax=Spirosoma montaniterrae TaxID=1178516 RepID=A0A1P9WRB5_9BACT|nr:nucleotidyltransferase substrate binding protein [Spirosoma montaniterrae]AQG77909.1 nucleotidyltransferase [Spirosoma montaniterrae]
MESKDVRWEQRFANYKKALSKLAETVTQSNRDELSELEQEGLIQRFEYTYELAWKTLQDLLRNKGYIDIAGPNPVLTQAFADGYITNAEGWRQMKKARELTSHTYNSETAEEIAGSVFNSYYQLLKNLEIRLEEERYGRQSNLVTL